MSNPETDTSRDWLSSRRTNLLAWWIPLAIMLAGLFFPVSLQTGAWLIALAWMGAACILNARRCNRTHCRYTGSYFLLMIVPVMALGTAFVSFAIVEWVVWAWSFSEEPGSYGGLPSGHGEGSRSALQLQKGSHLRFRMSRSLDV
jgi:hypothetical protein